MIPTAVKVVDATGLPSLSMPKSVAVLEEITTDRFFEAGSFFSSPVLSAEPEGLSYAEF